MQIDKVKGLSIIYDFKSPNGWIPNGLNYYYANKIATNDFKINQEIQDYFFKNFVQLSVFNVNLNANTLMQNMISIREYYKNRKKYKNDICFYLIEPFGSFNHFLGKQFGGFSESNFTDFISKDSLINIIENPNFFLVINYGTEGVFAVDFFSNLYDILEKKKIPREKVLLLSAAADIDELHKRVRNHNPDKIKTYYWPWSLRYKAKELKEIYDGVDYKFWDNIEQENTIVKETDLDKNKLRENKFILMNRRLRPHRWVLLCLLGDSFIKNNLVSFDVNLYDRENDIDFFKHHVSEKNHKYAFKNSDKLYEIKKSVIDYDDINSVWGFNFEKKEPYLNSYIHICSETNFYEDGLYFSEKTWKPMAHLQPFIQVNKQNALKEIRKIGFKTFHPFINEEYDNIKDDRLRMDAIYEEIKRLNNLSIQEIHEWYYSIQEILIHNRNLLFSFAENKEKTEFEFLNFIKNYVVN